MENPSHQDHPNYFTPILGGILGAAQLSTACLLLRPSHGTDFLLTGAISSDFIWSVPLGALLGVALSWALLWLPRRSHTRSAWRRTWMYATGAGFFVAPLAPGFLGLGPQTAAQLWEGFTILTCIAWLCVGAAALLERWIKQ